MKEKERCTKCKWVHEADSVAGTSFMGVELCPVHAKKKKIKNRRNKVLIVLQGGLIQEVLSTRSRVNIEILDLDIDDEYAVKIKARYNKIEKQKLIKN